MANPELEKSPQLSKPEGERFPSDEIPEAVERMDGTQANQQKFSTKTPISEQASQPPAVPKPKERVINPPVNKEELKQWSKGSSSEAKTWFGKYWLRMILKALHSGLKVVIGSNKKTEDSGN